jgi:hypothetical protein
MDNPFYKPECPSIRFQPVPTSDTALPDALFDA